MATIPGLPGLPGLNLGAQALEALNLPPVASSRQQDLASNTEYRFEVGFGRSLAFRLLSGTAEFFGTELAPSQSYTFQGTKGAIFTWHGCRLEISGDADSEYVAEETQMMSCANTHFALETLRDRTAQTKPTQNFTPTGPKILVVGPDSAGKTSLVRTLTSYAVKNDRQPVVVNLDPRQGMLSVPGALTAAAFSSIVDVEEGWGSSPISGPSPIPVKMPLVYHYGMKDADEGKLFKPLVAQMAAAVSSRWLLDEACRVAGCIIDSPASISQGKAGSYEIIDHIISEFSVNILVTLGSERLYSDLSRKYSSRGGDEPIHVLRLDKSGGCVDRSEEYMRALRHAQVKSYFFGHSAEYALAPHSQTADFDDLHIFRSIENDTTSSPANHTHAFFNSSAPIFEKLNPSPDMVGKLLAITSAAPSESQDKVRDASIRGYMWVADVDEAKKKVKVLCPQPGSVSVNALLLGRWPESVEGLVS